MNRSIIIATPGRCGSHGLMPILQKLLNLKEVSSKKYDINDFDESISIIHNLRAFIEAGKDINLIIMIRDPRDICVSAAYYVANKNKDRSFNTELETYLRKGIHAYHFFETYKAEQNLKHYLIKFEDFVQDPFAVISKCLDYFKYEYESEKLDILIKEYSFSHLHSFDPVMFHRGIIGIWKNYMTTEKNEEYCEKHAKLMKAWGYDK